MNYTAEDGLKVLEYLGLKISKEEISVFRNQWSQVYEARKNLIGATWLLYAEALPFLCGDGDDKSFLVVKLRDSDFGKRLDSTELDKELKQKSLEEIIKKGPHKFIQSFKF